MSGKPTNFASKGAVLSKKTPFPEDGARLEYQPAAFELNASAKVVRITERDDRAGHKNRQARFDRKYSRYAN